jgi:hypothetical protein
MTTVAAATSNNTVTSAAVQNGQVSEVPAQVVIRQIEAQTMIVPIIGLSPLITHRFSEKAKRIMLETMQGKSAPKEAKDPAAEYEAAFYRFADGGAGMPSIAFKAATVGGCRFYGKAVTMTAVKQFIFTRGEVGLDGQQLARIDGEPRMREDVVRVGRGGADLRYRPEFPEWRTELRVTFVTGSIDRDSVLSLIDAGGMGVGVGEWRPEKDGDFGTYRVDPDRQIEIVS